MNICQPTWQPVAQILVKKQFQATATSRENWLAARLSIREVSQGNPHIFLGKFRIFFQNFCLTHPCSKPPNNVVHRNPHPANTWSAATFVRFDGDDFSVVHMVKRYNTFDGWMSSDGQSYIYPLARNRSNASSLSWSCARVLRSAILVFRNSSMISSTVVAFDSTVPVHGAHPSDRYRRPCRA